MHHSWIQTISTVKICTRKSMKSIVNLEHSFPVSQLPRNQAGPRVEWRLLWHAVSYTCSMRLWSVFCRTSPCWLPSACEQLWTRSLCRMQVNFAPIIIMFMLQLVAWRNSEDPCARNLFLIVVTFYKHCNTTTNSAELPSIKFHLNLMFSNPKCLYNTQDKTCQSKHNQVIYVIILYYIRRATCFDST
jgi:hypothetical protein